MNKNTPQDIFFLLLSFFVPLILFVVTSSHSLMFDDAGEFALVIKLGSIAHPPGTPSFILIGMLWTKITAMFGMNHIDSLNLLAGSSFATSSLLLNLMFRKITQHFSGKETTNTKFICALCGIAFATSATAWAWANTVEVYSFQVLTFSVALYGLTSYHFSRKNVHLIIAALGLATGLGNHHVTMIFFLPFVPMFFLKRVFTSAEIPDKKKKEKNKQPGIIAQLKDVFKLKPFWLLTGLTAIVTLSYYGWMFYRAQSDYTFMFGKPDTLSELYYHMSGGAYTKNISQTSGSMISARLPYFLKLTMMELFVFIPFFIAGIVVILKKKIFPVFWIVVLYFLLLFLYQLNNNQWASTDAYMLMPFMALFIIVFYGAIGYADKIKAQYVIPVLLCVQIVYNFPENDRRSYPVSESLMTLLDKSAPKNSIVMISDWTTLIQYYYYRETENFRTDLTVMNYDIKFTHYRILPVLYPEFYKKIKPEYDHFIEELKKEHPHQISNTGCDLSTTPLNDAFKAVIARMETIARDEKKAFLTDPKAHYFYTNGKYYDSRRYVSGCFTSSMVGDTAANDYFLKMDFPFLKSPLLFADAGALDKLVDFQAELDSYLSFYTANNDSARIAKTQIDRDKVFKWQREMKKSMSFAYKLK